MREIATGDSALIKSTLPYHRRKLRTWTQHLPSVGKMLRVAGSSRLVAWSRGHNFQLRSTLRWLNYSLVVTRNRFKLVRTLCSISARCISRAGTHYAYVYQYIIDFLFSNSEVLLLLLLLLQPVLQSNHTCVSRFKLEKSSKFKTDDRTVARE